MNNLASEDSTADKVWQAKIESHRIAVANYLQTASKVSEESWHHSPQEDKWTPAQVTEHLVLTYQITLQELRGGQGLRPHYNFLLRPILRLTVLPKIFRSRRIPDGAKAPSEIMPNDSKGSSRAALKKLESLSGEFEREIFSRRNDEKARLSHHVFGAISLLQGVELAAIYAESHGRQLPIAETSKPHNF